MADNYNVKCRWDNLRKAMEYLRENIAEFSIGAVSLDDYRPIDKKIKTMRETLKCLNARLLILQVKNTRTDDEMPHESTEDTYQKLRDSTARATINNNAIMQCIHSHAIEDIMSKEVHVDIKKKMYDYLKKLFVLNDTAILTQRSIETAVKKQLDLKIENQKEIFNYNNFLKEQAQQRKQKLKETNPGVLKNKESMTKRIMKINIMKKLITNLIATSGKLLQEKPFCVEMLEKHAELINEETIIKLTENTAALDEA